MSRTIRSAVLLLSGALSLFAQRAVAQDWPQWRGANGDAKVAGFTAPASWPKTFTQAWKLPVGEGVATPALVGDKLYVFSRENGNEILRCLDAATGKEIWQEKYPAQGASGPASGFSGPRSSPAVANGKVVTLGLHGTLSCVDAATGMKIWRNDDFKGGTPRFQISSSPIIVEGLCIAQLGTPENGGIVAYDMGSGEQKWKWTGDGPAYASPTIMVIGDARLIVAETDRKVVAINVVDGKLAWEASFAPQGMGAYNAASPVVEGQTIIYSGGGRGTKAVKLEKSGDAYSATELWNNPEKSVQFSSPIVKDGLIYGLSGSNELFCLNAKTGQSTWTASIGQANAGGGPAGGPPRGPGGPGGGPGNGGGPGRQPGPPGGRGGRGGGGGGRGGYGSIIDAGSVLLVLTPASELVAFLPGDKEFTPQAKIKVADTPTYAYPVLSGKRLFIKDQESLILLNIE